MRTRCSRFVASDNSSSVGVGVLRISLALCILQPVSGLRLIRAVLTMEIEAVCSFPMNCVQSNLVGVNAVQIVLIPSYPGQSTRSLFHNI